MRGRVRGLRARGAGEVRPGIRVPARGTGEVPARGSEMAAADVSATEVATAAHGVPAPEVAPAPCSGVASPGCGVASTS